MVGKGNLGWVYDICVYYLIRYKYPLLNHISAASGYKISPWLLITNRLSGRTCSSSDRPDLWCVKDPRWDENGVMVSLQDGPSLPARGGQRAAQGLVDHALSYNNTVNDYMETLWLTMTLRRTTVQSIFQFKRVGECHTFPLSPYKWKREVDVSLSSPVVFAFQRFAVYTRIWI